MNRKEFPANSISNPWKLVQLIKYSKDIQIREYSDGGIQRYFRAKICGWNGFKFVSETLLPQQLVEATLIKCKELVTILTDNPSAINNMGTYFSL